jgi:hypothetical protein
MGLTRVRDPYPFTRLRFDNFYGSLMPIFGASNSPLDGTAVRVFRKEGRVTAPKTTVRRPIRGQSRPAPAPGAWAGSRRRS